MSPGQRLKKARESLGLTQSEFGEPLGFRWSKVKDIEAGKQKLTADIALKIQEIYRISFSWLMEGEGEMLIPVSADRMQYYEALPEPIQKTIKLFQKHPEKAWEFYAAVLERADTAEGKKKK
jgi:transcriptional regulator with XRE-family HTH domain